MRFNSILFERDADNHGEHGEPSVFADLNLDQVFDAAAKGRDEYDLGPVTGTSLGALLLPGNLTCSP